MTPTRQAVFDHLLPQLRDGTLPFEILLDWLEEHEAPHALWCLAWRDCPEPADGFQARWAAWLREREPVRRVTDPTAYRWRLVRDTVEDVELFVRLVRADSGVRQVLEERIRGAELALWRGGQAVLPPWVTDRPAFNQAEEAARAAIRRDRKRRVLALFPEVGVSWREPCGDCGGGGVYAAGGTCRTCLGVKMFTWEGYAPDLIPPEPLEYGSSSLRASYNAFWIAEEMKRALRRY